MLLGSAPLLAAMDLAALESACKLGQPIIWEYSQQAVCRKVPGAAEASAGAQARDLVTLRWGLASFTNGSNTSCACTPGKAAQASWMYGVECAIVTGETLLPAGQTPLSTLERCPGAVVLVLS